MANYLLSLMFNICWLINKIIFDLEGCSSVNSISITIKPINHGRIECNSEMFLFKSTPSGIKFLRESSEALEIFQGIQSSDSKWEHANIVLENFALYLKSFIRNDELHIKF